MAKPGVNGRPYQRLRDHISQRDKECGVCGDPIPQAARYPDPLSFSLDHITPRSLGGDPLDPANARGAHLICNSRRGNGHSTRRGRRRQRRRTAGEPIRSRDW